MVLQIVDRRTVAMPGLTPDLTIGEVTTLQPHEDATVVVRGDGINVIFDIGLPRGLPGMDSAPADEAVASYLRTAGTASSLAAADTLLTLTGDAGGDPQALRVTPKIRRPDAGYAVSWKTDADTLPGAWDLLVSHQVGYGLHVQTRAPGRAPAYVMAFGLDTDFDANTLGIGGLLIANKKGARGITIDQRDTITHTDAYGLNVLQKSDLAPAVRLEQLSATGAPLLQLFSTVGPTSTALLFDVVTANGRAGSINAGSGVINWARHVQIADQEAEASYFQAATKGSTPAAQRSYARLRKDGVVLHGWAGADNIWYPRGLLMNGQDLELRAGANASNVEGTPTFAAMKIRNNALAFYGSTPVGRPTGVAVTAAAIHAALVSLGLITA